MVDSVGASAQNQILQTLSRVDRKETSAEDALPSVQRDDTVSISREAQDIAEAQGAVVQISTELEQNSSLSLSADATRLADLA